MRELADEIESLQEYLIGQASDGGFLKDAQKYETLSQGRRTNPASVLGGGRAGGILPEAGSASKRTERAGRRNADSGAES